MASFMKLEIDTSAVAVGVAGFVVCHVVSNLTVARPRPALKSPRARNTPEATDKIVKEIPEADVDSATVDRHTDEAEPETEPQEPEPEAFRARSRRAAPQHLWWRLCPAVTMSLLCVLKAVLWQFPLHGTELEQVDSLSSQDASSIENETIGDHAEASDAPVQKNHISIPLTRQRLAKNQPGAALVYKSAYYATFTAGTPAQEFSLLLDTGSGHMILPSSYCRSEACKVHKRYRSSASASAVDILVDGTPISKKEARDEVTVSFGTGSVTGVLTEETVCLGDSVVQNHIAGNSTALAVHEQGASKIPQGCQTMRIIQATEMSEEPFKAFHSDGVLGLGLSGVSLSPEYNFLAMFSGPIAELGGQPKMFAFFLGTGNDEPSELVLGGYDDDRVEGDVHWNAVIDPEEGHWMIKLKSIRVNGAVIDFCHDGCKAVLDSGTSLLALPSKAFPTIYKGLWHRAALDGNCEGVGPQIEFEFEHSTISLGPEDYARPQKCKPPQSKGFGTENPFFQSTGAHGPTRNDLCCRPMLMSVDMEEPIGPKLFLLGEPVLQKYYTVYDAEKMRIGIGKARHEKNSVQLEADDADDSWWYEDESESEE